jgi:hypothetical protein
MDTPTNISMADPYGATHIEQSARAELAKVNAKLETATCPKLVSALIRLKHIIEIKLAVLERPNGRLAFAKLEREELYPSYRRERIWLENTCAASLPLGWFDRWGDREPRPVQLRFPWGTLPRSHRKPVQLYLPGF